MHAELLAAGTVVLILLAIVLKQKDDGGSWVLGSGKSLLTFAAPKASKGITKYIPLAHDTDDNTLVCNVESCGVRGLAICDTGSAHLVISLQPVTKNCLVQNQITPLYYGSETVHAKQTQHRVPVTIDSSEQVHSRVYWSDSGDSIMGLAPGNDVQLHVFEFDCRRLDSSYLILNPYDLLKGQEVHLRSGNFLQTPVEVEQGGKITKLMGVFDTGSSEIYVNGGNGVYAGRSIKVKTTNGVDLGTFDGNVVSDEFPPPLESTIIILGLPFFMGKRVQVNIDTMKLMFI